MIDAIDKYLFVLNLFKENETIKFRKIYDLLSNRFTCTDLGCRCILVSLAYDRLLEKIDNDKFKRTKKPIPKKWLDI